LEYEKMYLQGTPMLQIQKYAEAQYGEKYSYSTLQRHFSKHVKPVVEAKLKTARAHEEYIKAQIRKDIEIAKRLTRNLQILDDKIKEFLDAGESLDPKEKQVLLQYLAEIRQTIELLLKWSDRIQTEPLDEEEIFERILYCLQDLGPEQLKQFKKRWVEYNLLGKSTPGVE